VPVFYRKLVLASVLFLLGVVAVGLRVSYPDLQARGGLIQAIYVMIVLAMLGVAVFLGHYGGKLVFYWRRK